MRLVTVRRPVTCKEGLGNRGPLQRRSERSRVGSVERFTRSGGAGSESFRFRFAAVKLAYDIGANANSSAVQTAMACFILSSKFVVTAARFPCLQVPIGQHFGQWYESSNSYSNGLEELRKGEGGEHYTIKTVFFPNLEPNCRLIWRMKRLAVSKRNGSLNVFYLIAVIFRRVHTAEL